MARYIVIIEYQPVSFADAKGKHHIVPARVRSMEFASAFLANNFRKQAEHERGAKTTMVDREDEWDKAGAALLARLAKSKVA